MKKKLNQDKKLKLIEAKIKELLKENKELKEKLKEKRLLLR